MRNIDARERGASLVEAIIAMALLSLLVTFVFRPLAASDRATAQVAARRAALNLASELMDYAQICPVAQLVSTGGVRQVTCADASGQCNIPCEWTSTITQVRPGFYTVKITVKPPTGGQPIVLESERIVLGAAS